MKSLLCATALAMSLLAPIAHAADYTMVDRNIIGISGEIIEGDENTLSLMLARANSSGTPIVGAFLNSPGGKVAAGVNMAKLIRANNIVTAVVGNNTCASICVLLFAAGVKRGHMSTASIGVHSAMDFKDGQDGKGVENGDSMVVTTWLARLYKDYGTPDSIIGKLVTTPGDQVAWISNTELVGSGFSVLIDDYVKPQQPTVPQQPVQPQQQYSWKMTCQSQKGTYYDVGLYNNGTIQVRNTTYAVTEGHWATAESGAYVATGKTKYGIYAAVFYGPNPRMVYRDKKTQVIDYCH
jgi:hypothetical protein